MFELRNLNAAIIGALLLSYAPLAAIAQDWKPERPVELIVGCAPGCGPDNMARLMQRVFQANRYFDTPLLIQNKVGTMARIYLNQFEGNGHYLYSADRGLLSSHAMGRAQYTDITPVAMLFGEYIAVAVKADSPIKSGRDLIERLKKDPTAHSFGIATSRGNVNHQSVAGPLKSAGVDHRKIRNVTFNSGAHAITALLGGHIDAVPVSSGLWVPHMQTGVVRVIAVSSAQRLPGPYAEVPTWREQGGNFTVFNWRAIFGPKGMTPAHVAFWETVFQRLLETPEWAAEMVMRNGIPKFMNAAATRKYMEDEYPEVKAFLVDLELAKR